MSRRKRTSAVAGLVLALALAVAPTAQAAGRSRHAPGFSLEVGFRLAGWWERAVSLLLPASKDGGEKIGAMIDPDGATTPTPPPAARTCEGCSEIGSGVDPNG